MYKSTSLSIAEVALCCCGADSRGGLPGSLSAGLNEVKGVGGGGGLSLTSTQLAGTRPPYRSASEPGSIPSRPGQSDRAT